MDAGDPEPAPLQGASGSHHRPRSHSRDRYGIVSLPPNRREAEERSQSKLTAESRGNDGPWKAWKTKGRFSTLPTALGNRSAIPTFPPLRLLSLYKRYKRQRIRVRQKPPHLKNQQLRVGQIKMPKWAEYSCQTHHVRYAHA